MNWKFLLLLVVSGVLLILTWLLSKTSQAAGVVFLGIGLLAAALSCSFWYLFHPNAGWRDSGKFFSLVAANVILFVLGTVLMSSGIQGGVVFFGLFGVVLSYSVWVMVDSNSGWFDLAREILKAFLVLLALLGIALTLQGLGSLTGLGGLDSMGRDLAKLFGGS